MTRIRLTDPAPRPLPRALRAHLAAACATLLAACALAAPSAQAASAPTVLATTNTFDGNGGTTVRGYVTPEGAEITSCRFLYGPTEAYGSEAPCQPGAAAIGDEVQRLLVAAESGQYKLGLGAESTPDLPFDATAAEVQSALEALPALGAGNVSVALGPGRYLTIRFQGALAHTEVGSLTVANGTTPLQGNPVAVGGLPATVEPVEPQVSADISGLPPGATYHFAIEATNAQGTTTSDDAPFLTPAPPGESCPNAGMPGTAFLPSCRAWEMVSPPDKNGGSIITYPSRTHLAEDGTAAAFASLTGFADARGSGIGFEYLSERSASPEPGDRGWSTHAITPPEPAMTVEDGFAGRETTYVEEFSPDLERAVVQSFGPLGGDPNVAAVPDNLYRREDLRTPGAGTYSLLSGCPLCGEGKGPLKALPAPAKPLLIGATPDLSKVIFESPYNLAKGATGTATKLYESDSSGMRLAGIAPDGTPFPESSAGSGMVLSGFYTHAAISADGSKVFFTDTPGGAASLYMRQNGTETVRLDVPEGTGAGPSPAGRAHFWDASASGSRVFFTTKEKLTPDAPEAGLPDLYVYDTTRPASDPHNLTFVGVTASQGQRPVIGASADGSTVYFFGGLFLKQVFGVPVSEPSGASPLLAWHEGRLGFVAWVGADGLNHSSYDGSSALSGKWTRIAPSGQLLFHTTDPVGPTGYDQGAGAPACHLTFTRACDEYYSYDPATGNLQCVSCNPTGAPARASAEQMHSSSEVGQTISNGHLPTLLSADGRYAFFSSADALLPEDTNGVSDAYAYDTRTGRLGLLSSGTGEEPSYFVEASPSGRDALFTTTQPLIGWDTDGANDLYDARVGGGFPEPPALAAPCEGESCRGPSPQAGSPPSLASSTLHGPGNPPISRPKPCPKGTRTIRRHGKRHCLKPHRAHHHKKGTRR